MEKLLEKTGIATYLTFRVSEEHYAINVKNVVNILEMFKITKVPHAPDYLKGIINLRGQILPVIDIRLKLGIQGQSDLENACILVLEIEKGKETVRFGGIVDSVKDVSQFSNNKIVPPPSIGNGSENNIIYGIVTDCNDLIILLDIDRLLDDHDISQIKEIHHQQK